MDAKELTALLQNPASIHPDQTAALKATLEKYPYFQAARSLRLKGLRNENSLHYNKELKITAAYTVDRSVLFDYITSEVFDQNAIADQIKKQELSEKTTEPDTPTPQHQDVQEELDRKLRVEHNRPLKEDPEPHKETKEPSSGEEQDLHLGEPLHFDRKENHSFSEWLKLTSAKPVKRQDTSSEDNENKSRKFDLIDKFILSSPKIDPTIPSKKTNLAEERLTAPESLMTETLARVYLEQKNYKKAVQAYKILILKNPEKSGFFADQIRAIEKLKEQNNID